MRGPTKRAQVDNNHARCTEAISLKAKLHLGEKRVAHLKGKDDRDLMMHGLQSKLSLSEAKTHTIA